MIEETIWNFVHHFKTELTKDEQESFKSFVTGSDNWYRFGFLVFDNEYTLPRIIQFKISKNYSIVSSRVNYVIDQVRIDGLDIPGETDKINELLYSKLIPYIRELKLSGIGI